jgi:hypothetical protein
MSEIFAEEIIRNKRKLEQADKQEDFYQIENDITKGYVVVKYETLGLEEKEIIDGRFTMLLPSHFEEMDPDLKAVKYPGPESPDWVYSNESGDVSITFTLENGEIKPEEVPEVRDILAKELKRLYPSSAIEDKKTIGDKDNSISLFSMDIPLIDGACYHLMFLREVREGLLIGSFDCSIDEKKQWQQIMLQLLETLRETDV